MKFEAFHASAYSPKILDEAGVPMAIKADHPVIFAGDLAFEAAKAHHYGVSEQDALVSFDIFCNSLGVTHSRSCKGHRNGSSSGNDREEQRRGYCRLVSR